ALDALSLRLEPGAAAPEVLSHLALLGLPLRRLSVGMDPVSDLACSGRLLTSAGVSADIAKAISLVASAQPQSRLLAADGRAFSEAGASETLELAATLAAALFYLRLIEAAGIDLATARHLIEFILPADADIVVSIAKLRALRLLWARLEVACGLVPAPI